MTVFLENKLAECDRFLNFFWCRIGIQKERINIKQKTYKEFKSLQV